MAPDQTGAWDFNWRKASYRAPERSDKVLLGCAGIQ